MNARSLLCVSVACAFMTPAVLFAGPDLLLDLGTTSDPTPQAIQSSYYGPGPVIYAFLVVASIDSVRGVSASLNIDGSGVTVAGPFTYVSPWVPADTTTVGFSDSGSRAVPCPSAVGYWTLVLSDGTSSHATVSVSAPGGSNGPIALCLDAAGRAVSPTSIVHAAINASLPPPSYLSTAHAFRDTAACKVIFLARPGALALPLGCSGAPLQAITEITPSLRAALGAFDPVQVERCIPEASQADSLLLTPGGRVVQRAPLWNAYRAIVSSTDAAQELLSRLQEDSTIVFAEPCREFLPTVYDPRFSEQWHLDNTGQGGGQADADIDAPEAWAQAQGSPSVRICLIDSGVYKQHPDLVARPVGGDNGIDTDSGRRGHGTKTMGMAFTVANNGTGTMPTDWTATVLAGYSRWFHLDGLAENVYRAMEWQSNIISMSWKANDLEGDPLLLKYALRDAYRSGIGLIASAGNDNSSDERYPAAWPFVVAVSGTDKRDREYDGSSFGSWVDLSAPGEEVLTTCMPGSGGYLCNSAVEYDVVNGTSLSAPLVAGVAGLVKGANAGLYMDDVFEILKRTADDLGEEGFDPHFGHGRVNADRAVHRATHFDFVHDFAIVGVFAVEDLGIRPIQCDGTYWYRVYRYELQGGNTWIGHVDFIDGWVVPAYTVGVSGDPSTACWYPWGQLTGLGSDWYSVRTFVYELRDMDNHFVKWMPCAPEDAYVTVTLRKPAGVSGAGVPQGGGNAGLRWALEGRSPGSGSCSVVLSQSPGAQSEARVSVVDAGGRVRRRLWEGVVRGREVVTWDGRDDQGGQLPAGVYFIRVGDGRVGDSARRVVVIR